jgi:NADH-quinone oxidoreductase subunit A
MLLWYLMVINLDSGEICADSGFRPPDSCKGLTIERSIVPGTFVSVMLWPFLLYFVVVVILLATIIGFSHILGERHRERTTGEPYESGMMLTGSTNMRFAADFYLMAVLFVIFDLEAAFIIGWAVAVREAGWAGYVEMAIFIGVLLAALVYLWGSGALDFRRGGTAGGRGSKVGFGGPASRVARTGVTANQELG